MNNLKLSKCFDDSYNPRGVLTRITISLIGITIVSGTICSSVNVNADNTDVVDNVNVTIPISCTMGGSITTGQEHSASISPNTYQTNIGKTTITTTCNDAGGYALYAIGFTGDMHTGVNHTKLIGTNTGTTISTGLYTVGTTTDSVWSMKVDKITDSTISYQPNYLTINNDFNDYHTVPDTYIKVATYTAPTDVGNNALGSKIETTYAAYINSSQPADTYTGKVKYTLVHPNNAPAPVPLPDPSTSCTTKVPGITYMQELNSSNTATIMANMTDGTQYYLRDSRDDEPYCVSKIAGAIWMTENLRITGTIPAEGSNFTGSDMNISVNDLTVGNSFTEARTHVGVDNEGHPTVWYNYCAASAGQVCTQSVRETTQDICPSGWKMPSSLEASTLTDNNNSDPTVKESFHPVKGGFYSDGVNYRPDRGYWWASTYVYTTDGYNYFLTSNDNNNLVISYIFRSYGHYIRCIRGQY